MHFCLFVVKFGPCIAIFWWKCKVVDLIQIMSVSVIFCSVGATKLAVLNREMRFKILAIRN